MVKCIYRNHCVFVFKIKSIVKICVKELYATSLPFIELNCIHLYSLSFPHHFCHCQNQPLLASPTKKSLEETFCNFPNLPHNYSAWPPRLTCTYFQWHPV